MSKNIQIENLPLNTTVAEVEKMCGVYGKVAKVTVETTIRTSIATVEMGDDTSGGLVIKGLDNAKMGANILNVNEARPREE